MPDKNTREAPREDAGEPKAGSTQPVSLMNLSYAKRSDLQPFPCGSRDYGTVRVEKDKFLPSGCLHRQQQPLKLA